MRLKEFSLNLILNSSRSEQERYLFGKKFLCKINGEYYAGQFGYATKIHPEIFFREVPWNPSGHQLRKSYGWEGIWQIVD